MPVLPSSTPFQSIPIGLVIRLSPRSDPFAHQIPRNSGQTFTVMTADRDVNGRREDLTLPPADERAMIAPGAPLHNADIGPPRAVPSGNFRTALTRHDSTIAVRRHE